MNLAETDDKLAIIWKMLEPENLKLNYTIIRKAADLEFAEIKYSVIP